MRTVYEFSVKDRKGKNVSLKEYSNEVLLIVNTATQCDYYTNFRDFSLHYRENIPMNMSFTIGRMKI